MPDDLYPEDNSGGQTTIDPEGQTPVDIIDTGVMNVPQTPEPDAPAATPEDTTPNSPSVGPNIDHDVLQDMHTFPSIDKSQALGQDTYDLFDRVQKADQAEATVFQGNFVSEYAEKTFRGLTIKNMEAVSNEAVTLGDTFLKGAGADETNRDHIVGHQIRNFGIYAGHKAAELLAARRESHPVNEGQDAAGLAADVTVNTISAVALILGGTAAAAAAGAAAPEAAVMGSATAAAAFSSQIFGNTYAASRYQPDGATGMPTGTEKNSYQESMSWAVLATGVNGALQFIGLNKIFGITYGSTTDIVTKRLIDGAASMGIVSGLQTMVQLGVNKGAGIGKQISLQEFIVQTIYASAVGAFSGGIMTGLVVLPMRAKAIEALRESGMDNEQARAAYKELNQKAMDNITNKMSKAVGLEAAHNAVIQRAFDIRADYLNTRNYPKEQFVKDVAGIIANDRGKEFLDPLAARSAAEVRGREAPDVNIPGETKTMAVIQTMEKAAATPTKELDAFEVAQPEWNVNVEPGTKKIIEGRINKLNEENKTLWKEFLDLQKELEEMKYGATPNQENLLKGDQLSQHETELQKKIMDNFEEATALAHEGQGADMKGTGLSLKASDLIQTIAGFAKQIVKTAQANFKAGRLTTRAEFRFIKESLNRLINVPGLSKETRALLKYQYSKLTTAEALYKNAPLILDAVQEAQNDGFVTGIKIGIDKLVTFFKGGESGRAGLRSVKLDVESQKVADAFVKEYEDEQTDPAARQYDLKSDPEKIIRFMASQLATGKNGLLQDLQPRDYASMYQVLADFARNGKESAVFAAAVLKQTKANMAAQVIEDILGGNTNITARTGNEYLLDTVAKLNAALDGNYDMLLGLLARHSEDMMGKSFTENALSAHAGQRLAEAFRMFFISEHNNAIIESFPELDGMRSNIRDWKMKDSELYGGNSVHFTFNKTTDDPDVPGELVSIDLTRGAAREKLALKQRLEGDRALRHNDWNDEAFKKLEAAMRPEDVAYVSAQLKIYSDIYEHLNAVFRKIAGYDLPRSRNYSSIISQRDVAEGISMVARLFGADTEHSPSIQAQDYFKPAVGRGKLQDIEDFQKLDWYINDTTHYIGMAETVERMRSVFSNSEVRDAVRSRYGDGPLNDIKRYTDVLTNNSLSVGQTKLQTSLSRAVNRLAGAFISARPVQALKHLTTMFGGMEVTGISKYFKYLSTFPDAWKSGELRELTDHPYFRSRGQTRAMSRDFRLIQEQKRIETSPSLLNLEPGPVKDAIDMAHSFERLRDNPKLNDILMLPAQLGDFGGIAMSTWPVYKYYQEIFAKENPGMSAEQVKGKALNAAIEHANRTQGSPDYTQSPVWMLNPDPFSRLYSMFRQRPFQYMAQVMRHLENLGTERFDPVAAGKAYAIFFVALPTLFDYFSKAGQPQRDEGWGRYALRRMTVGPFDEIPIAGPLLKYVVINLIAGTQSLLTGEEVKGESAHRLGYEMAGLGSAIGEDVKQVTQAFKKSADSDWDAELVAHLVTKAAELTYPVTGPLGSLAGQLSRSVEVLLLANDGDLADNWRRYFMLLGLSKYATEKPKDENGA